MIFLILSSYHLDTSTERLGLTEPTSMTTSRAESQHTQYGRRRSNTATSLLRTPATPVPLKYGDSKVLNLWVHDQKESQTVIFNQTWWQGAAEGDMLRVTGSGADSFTSGFLFIVPKDEGCAKPQLQVCIKFTPSFIHY